MATVVIDVPDELLETLRARAVQERLTVEELMLRFAREQADEVAEAKRLARKYLDRFPETFHRLSQ